MVYVRVRRLRRGLIATPANGQGLRRALRLRFGEFFFPLRRYAIVFFPFFRTVDDFGFAPIIARCGFSMNGSPP